MGKEEPNRSGLNDGFVLEKRDSEQQEDDSSAALQ